MQVQKQPEVPIKHVFLAHTEEVRTPEEKEIAEVADSTLKELRETKLYDFTGNTFTSFLRKAARFLNFTKYLGGNLNSHTIIRGSLKEWDPKRLKEGKHPLLGKLGGEHLEFISTTHEKVDAHYFEASKFLEKLNEMGGERKVLRFNFPKDSPFFTANKVNLLVAEDFSIEMHELDSSKLDLEDREKFEIAERTLRKFGKTLVKDEATGKHYALDVVSYERLLKTSYNTKPEDSKNPIFSDFKIDETIKREDNFLNFSNEIPAIVFKQSDLERHKDIELEKLLYQTSWQLVFGDNDNVYLVRRSDGPALEMFFMPNRFKDPEMTLSIADAEPLEPTKKTILITQNQTDIYEQHVSEIFSYALEGINVLAYNNPGKGLSTGLADNANLNASIESAYQYLHQIRKVKDEDIIAKGQCFGAAPTGWLGRKHPKINLIMDQNLANFHEKVMKEVRLTSEKAVDIGKKRAEIKELEPKVKELIKLETELKILLGFEPVIKELEELYKEIKPLEEKRWQLQGAYEPDPVKKAKMESELKEHLKLIESVNGKIAELEAQLKSIDAELMKLKDSLKQIVDLESEIIKLEAKGVSNPEYSEEIKERNEELKKEMKVLNEQENYLMTLNPGVSEEIKKITAKIKEIAERKDRTLDETAATMRERILEVDKFEYKSLERWAPYIIKLNYIVEGVVRAIFSGYNTADDIKANQGHKLIHINVPGYGGGGDELVLPHHPELMIEGFTTPNKELKLSMNPGGTHVTDWWMNQDSQRTVMDFFRRTSTLPDLTKHSEYKEELKAIPTKFRSKPKPTPPSPPKEEKPKEEEDFFRDRMMWGGMDW